MPFKFAVGDRVRAKCNLATDDHFIHKGEIGTVSSISDKVFKTQSPLSWITSVTVKFNNGIITSSEENLDLVGHKGDFDTMHKPNVKNMTDEDIKALEKALKEETVRREKAKEEGLKESTLKFFKSLTIEQVNFIAPEHGRTSCSDENLINGWYSAEYNKPRCNRCALLQAMLERHHPSVVTFDFQLIYKD